VVVSPRLSGLARWMAFAILLVSGYNMTQPNYSWGVAYQVLHGVFVDDILLTAYVVLALTIGVTRLPAVYAPALVLAGLAALLGALGIISTGVNPYRAYDLGQAVHLFLFAAYTLLAVVWTRRGGDTFVLRSFLLGALIGGVVNLYFSIRYPKLIIGLLPVLRQQNGVGGLLAVAVLLGAWLVMIRKTRADMAVGIAISVIGVLAAAMSYSKIAMSITALGFVAWSIVIGQSLGRRHMRLVAATGLLMLGAGGVYAARSPVAIAYVESVGTSLYAKFVGIDLENPYSVGERYMYFWAVSEIMTAHPLTGVSYGGFYDAIIRTSAYRSGRMIEEDPEAGQQGISNPHSSFLYYASANGVPGLLVCAGIYLVFLAHLLRSVRHRGMAGYVFWACCAITYFIYGMTLPTLFSTPVLYLPAAVAIAIVMGQRSLAVVPTPTVSQTSLS
jgi:O-antigen ligase